MKVETHNHPTAISPWPGAATGSGGEIRDEGATLSLLHISEPTRLGMILYARFCLKKKNKQQSCT
nr:hypothetical protein [Escherichia coli]